MLTKKGTGSQTLPTISNNSDKKKTKERFEVSMGEMSNNLKQRQRLNLVNLQSHYHFSSLEAIKIIKQQLYLGISDALTPQWSENRDESVLKEELFTILKRVAVFSNITSH